jgi:hypothetical protein
MTFQWRICTTWMKRDANEEVGQKESGRKYFVPHSRCPQYRQRSANPKLIKVIECVCVNGTFLLPGFVFSGKEFSPEWFMVNPEIWYVCLYVHECLLADPATLEASQCRRMVGQMNPYARSGKKKSFSPQATAQNMSGKPILLIYDGHGSHNTLELIELAREHNIILFCLPPHTTHKLQPLQYTDVWHATFKSSTI